MKYDCTIDHNQFDDTLPFKIMHANFVLLSNQCNYCWVDGKGSSNRLCVFFFNGSIQCSGLFLSVYKPACMNVTACMNVCYILIQLLYEVIGKAIFIPYNLLPSSSACCISPCRTNMHFFLCIYIFRKSLLLSWYMYQTLLSCWL